MVEDSVWDRARQIVQAITRRPSLAVAVFHLLGIHDRHVAGPWTWEPNEGPEVYVRWPVNLQRLEVFQPRDGFVAVVRPLPDGSAWRIVVRPNHIEGNQVQEIVDGDREGAQRKADIILRDRNPGAIILDKLPEKPLL